MNKNIHFNNAGSSLILPEAVDAEIKYLQDEANYGGYETEAAYHSEFEQFYTEAAKLINAEPEEIAFAESATVAWQRAFSSIQFHSGDVIVTSNSEYASNFISYLLVKATKNIDIIVAPANADGEIDTIALEKICKEKQVKLIALTHIPTNGGIVNPAEEVGAIAKKYDVLYLLDACQAIGQYPLDVKNIQCDFLTATGRKYLRGPRGTGMLYVSKKILKTSFPASLDMLSASWKDVNNFEPVPDAKRFETYERHKAGQIGLTYSFRFLNHYGIEKAWLEINTLGEYMRKGLGSIPTVEVKDLGKTKGGIVTFTTPLPASSLKQQLHNHGFNVSVSLPVGTLLDSIERNLPPMIRASLHYYNTKEEVDLFIDKLKQLIKITDRK